MLSVTQKPVIPSYEDQRPAEVVECSIFQTLSSMNNLRTLTLTLIECDGAPFILALDPKQNMSKLVRLGRTCPLRRAPASVQCQSRCQYGREPGFERSEALVDHVPRSGRSLEERGVKSRAARCPCDTQGC